MSADKIKKIDNEIHELHIQIKKTNHGLCKRLKDIIEEMPTWDGFNDEHHNGKRSMSGESESRF